MREIKFRAWNESLKSMYDVSELYVDTDGKLKEVGRFKTILMQFIGEKDKGDVEIYEGDIVSYEGGTWVVEFVDGGFYIPTMNDSVYWGECEVIGNIHESHELINK